MELRIHWIWINSANKTLSKSHTHTHYINLFRCYSHVHKFHIQSTIYWQSTTATALSATTIKSFKLQQRTNRKRSNNNNRNKWRLKPSSLSNRSCNEHRHSLAADITYIQIYYSRVCVTHEHGAISCNISANYAKYVMVNKSKRATTGARVARIDRVRDCHSVSHLGT